jgi:hypothetical protein
MDAPEVRLYHNPWSQILDDGVVLQTLQTAAVGAAETLTQMIGRGEVEDDRDSYAAVLVDPTNQRSRQNEATDVIFAAILIGPNALKYLPNAVAKADAHDRHCVPNGLLVEQASYCLGDGDFAYGNSAAWPPYVSDEEEGLTELAIAGGSGLSVEQDGEMAFMLLDDVMPRIRMLRDTWIAEQRSAGSHGWYNRQNEPGEQYMAILEKPYTSPATS